MHGYRETDVRDLRLLFDRDWYVAEHPEAGPDPFSHYLQVGAVQGFDPNPLFDTDWYLQQNPDVAATGLNPLIHFVQEGAAQGRDPNPYFDTDWYVARNPTVAAAGLNPLLHYLQLPLMDLGDPSPLFHARWYLQHYKDVVAAGVNPLVHFLHSGAGEGRIPRMPIELSERSPSLQHGKFGPPYAKPTGQDRALPAGYPVDVIIPVYRGLSETRSCIESVLRTCRLNHAFGQLILIDDCSPEPLLQSYLEDVTTRETSVLLLTNTTNLGFTASINRGISAAGDRDVVLLNSDSEVCGNWLDRLALQAYVDSTIATVTPFSNNATVCYYPEIEGRPHLPPGLSLQGIDRACIKANTGLAVDLPTGVGSCMFVKRTCLLEVGRFDEVTFGKGYGEEVDFCQRALQLGWRHVLAGDVFVFHVGGVSFGASSSERKIAAGARLLQLYPDFDLRVKRWFSNDPAKQLRQQITAAIYGDIANP